MGNFRLGNVCTVCGEYDAFLDHKHPHENFCEHCYNILDDWFDELMSDLRTSAKAFRGKEITEDEVVNAIQFYLWEKENDAYERGKNRKTE